MSLPSRANLRASWLPYDEALAIVRRKRRREAIRKRRPYERPIVVEILQCDRKPEKFGDELDLAIVDLKEAIDEELHRR